MIVALSVILILVWFMTGLVVASFVVRSGHFPPVRTVGTLIVVSLIWPGVLIIETVAMLENSRLQSRGSKWLLRLVNGGR
jgi:hypothetical protein